MSKQIRFTDSTTCQAGGVDLEARLVSLQAAVAELESVLGSAASLTDKYREWKGEIAWLKEQLA